MIKNKFVRILSFFIFPAVVFLFSIFIGFFFNAYNVFPWIDIPMHFIGGFSIGFMGFLFLNMWREEKIIQIKSKFVFLLVIAALVSFVAVLWEFWEFGMDLFFNLEWQLTLNDTLGDLFFGLLGGLSFGIFKFLK